MENTDTQTQNANAVSSTDLLGWSSDPPKTEGLWWLYGDEEFGTMGGNYSGSIPAIKELHMVKVIMIGSSLTGIAGGRMIPLRPFNENARRSGYVGVWQKVDIPVLPNVKAHIPHTGAV